MANSNSNSNNKNNNNESNNNEPNGPEEAPAVANHNTQQQQHKAEPPATVKAAVVDKYADRYGPNREPEVKSPTAATLLHSGPDGNAEVVNRQNKIHAGNKHKFLELQYILIKGIFISVHILFLKDNPSF